MPNFGCRAAASAISDSAVAREFIMGIPCLPTRLHASRARTAFLWAARTSRGDAGRTLIPPTRVMAGVVMAFVSGISAYPSTSVRKDLSLEHGPPPAPRRHHGGVLSSTFLATRCFRSLPSPKCNFDGAFLRASLTSFSVNDMTLPVSVQNAPTSIKSSRPAWYTSSASELSFGMGFAGSNLILCSLTFSWTLGAKLLSW